MAFKSSISPGALFHVFGAKESESKNFRFTLLFTVTVYTYICYSERYVQGTEIASGLCVMCIVSVAS